MSCPNITAILVWLRRSCLAHIRCHSALLSTGARLVSGLVCIRKPRKYARLTSSVVAAAFPRCTTCTTRGAAALRTCSSGVASPAGRCSGSNLTWAAAAAALAAGGAGLASAGDLEAGYFSAPAAAGARPLGTSATTTLTATMSLRYAHRARPGLAWLVLIVRGLACELQSST